MSLSALGKGNVLGIEVDAIDYDGVAARVLHAADAGTPYLVSATAVHGIMCGVLDRHHRYRLNRFDVIAPDGQPVRWALNMLHRAGLPERTYGPELMLRLCASAAAKGVPIGLYGSDAAVQAALGAQLTRKFPALRIAYQRPSLFRRSSAEEQSRIRAEIRQSGARLLFVGLGCPRQEVWTYENAGDLSLPVIAVGAAFDFHAGSLPQAPAALQKRGLEWAYRLWQEPRRLWRRYVFLNPLYLMLLAMQALRIRSFGDRGEIPSATENYA